MNSKCFFSQMTIPAAHLGGSCAFPSVLPVFNLQTSKSGHLDEEDELFTDVGRIRSVYPYRQQNLYDRAAVPTGLKTAVLENERLRATFLTELGGRLWSLYDKREQRELLYCNDVLRYGNLALRNAWFSGGVEWNIGMVGHSPFTCEPLFVSVLQANDGTPILRMYEYERIRNVTYQMDFSLPEGSDFLYCRMRICNLQDKTIPMYWWSNIAVKEPGSRTIVPAHATYYSAWNFIGKMAVPMRRGKDVSYAENTECSMDFFYHVPKRTRKFIFSAEEDGYGLLQTSTDRLQGRKMFVWGNSQGGHRWQDFLTRQAGNYAEIQAGLGRTQYECIPMPPLCAWEWMEAYGPAALKKEEAHGDWDQAIAAVEQDLSRRLDEEALEEKLRADKEDYVRRRGKLVQKGSGFGALENLRRQKEGLPPISDYLDFGEPDAMQADFVQLLAKKKLPCPDPDEIPPADLCGTGWLPYAEAAAADQKDNWYAHYVLGLLYLSLCRDDEAMAALQRSLACEQTCWADYALGACLLAKGEKRSAADHMLLAFSRRSQDASLAKDVCRLLEENEAFEEMEAFCTALPEELAKVGKMRFYRALALAHNGKLQEAEALLYADGGLVIPDIREGEVSITDLYLYIQKEKAAQKGLPFDETTAPVPKNLDFRMGHLPEEETA